MKNLLLFCTNLAVFSTLLDHLTNVELEPVHVVQGMQVQGIDLDLPVDVKVFVNQHHQLSVVVVCLRADGVIAAVVENYRSRQLVHAVANFFVSNVLVYSLYFIDESPLTIDEATLACDDLVPALVKDWYSKLDSGHLRLAVLQEGRFTVLKHLLHLELLEDNATRVRLASFTDAECSHVVELNLLVVQHVARQGFQISLHCVLIDVGRHDERVINLRDEALATLVFPLVEPEAVLVPSKFVAGDGQLKRRIVDSLDIREGDLQHRTSLGHGDVGSAWLLHVTNRDVDCLARISSVGDREASKFVAERVNAVLFTLLSHPIS